ISGNTAPCGGGISVYAAIGIATVQNATITHNNANTVSGGIFAAGGIFKRGTAWRSITVPIRAGWPLTNVDWRACQEGPQILVPSSPPTGLPYLLLRAAPPSHRRGLLS